MNRLFGCVLIMIGSIAFGFQKSFELQSHVKELEGLKQVFIMLKDEMMYARSSLGEMFHYMSKKSEGVYQLWLHMLSEDLRNRNKGTFQEIWSKSIFTLETESHLTKSETEELKLIGQNLSSIESLNMYLGQLDLAIEKARNEASNKKKIYQSVGILGGIFLIIILM